MNPVVINHRRQAVRALPRFGLEFEFARQAMATLILAVFLVALSGLALADDTGHRHTVVVPYDSSRSPDEQQPEQFYIDYDTFQRLWKRAKDKRLAAMAADDVADLAASFEGQDFALTSALYQASVGDKKVEVEGRLVLVTRGKEWQKVPMAFEGASVSELTLDGGAVAYEGGAILVEKPGLHEVGVRFEVPLGEAGAGEGGDQRQPARWSIPPAAASMLALTMADEDAVPVVNGGLPSVESSPGGGGGNARVFTVALGQGGTVDLSQRLRTRGKGMTQPSVASIDSHLFVTPALERLEARYGLVFRGQEESSFSISFDASLTPARIEIPNLASWRLVEASAADSEPKVEAGLRRLDFELTQPARDGLVVRLVAERLIEDVELERSFPRFGAAALRLEQRQSLLRVDDLNVRTLPAPSHRQLEFLSAGVDLAGFAPVATFGLAGSAQQGSLRYAVEPRPGNRSAEVDYVYQVAADKVETVAQLKIRSPQSTLAETIIGLPPGTTIQGVRGNRLQEWWRTGDDLFVRFSGATSEVTALLIYLSRETEDGAANANANPAAGRQLRLEPLSLPEVESVTGTGLVVAHATVDTALKFTAGRDTVREVDASAVANDFAVLPPLERKRSYEFFKADVGAELTLRPVAPRYDVTWALLARTFESWVKISAQVDVAVSQSAIDEVSFSLPEELPEVKVVSPEVRELRSTVADGRRSYTVVFQRFVTDAIDFVIETEVAHSGELTLGELAFDGATREERFVIVDNGSSDRLQVTPTAMERTVADLLPFEPAALDSAQFFRARSGWEVTLAVEELQTSAGNDAVVLWSELTTAFRANGEEWLKAVYHLQNRSLQFMPVVLPEGAELVSVSVAGEATRADRRVAADGREAVLVPLIQTRPGHLAYDVELTLRSLERVHEDGRKVSRLVRDLDDPDVMGIVVQRTMWHVALPEGFTLKDFEGNLQPMSEEELLFERAENDLAEMESLNLVGSSVELGAEANWLGVNNGEVVDGRIERTLSQLGEAVRYRGDDDLARREQDLRQRWGRQQVVLTENRILLPVFDQSGQPVVAEGKSKDAAAASGDLDGDGVVDWNINNDQLKSRNAGLIQAETAQLDQLEGQLRLNDNIAVGNQYFNREANIQGEVTPAVAGEAAADDGKKVKSQVGKLSEVRSNGEVEEKLEQITYSQIGHGGTGQMLANGTVAAQEEGGQPGQSSSNGMVVASGGFIDLSQSVQSPDQGQAGMAFDSAPAQGQNQAQDQQAGATSSTNAFGDYDNARSTNLKRRSVQPQPSAAKGKAAPEDSAPAPTTAKPAGGAAGMGLGFDDLASRTAARPGSGAAAGAPRPGLETVPRLKVTGRRSVAVEFPSEGTVYHFKKVKDRARLSLVAAETRDLRRLGWLILFLLCAMGLFAVDAGFRQVRGRQAQ